MHNFVILSLIATIISAQDQTPCTSTDTTPCDPNDEQCVNGFCEAPMAQIEPVLTACTAFDNCEEYFEGCYKYEYESDTATYESKLVDGCDPLNPPVAQCKDCMEFYELAPQSTCCVVSTSLMSTAMDTDILTLFNDIDTDNSDAISEAEYDAFIATLAHKKLTDEQADVIFDFIDTDGDNVLSADEVLNAYLWTDAQEIAAVEAESASVESVETEEVEIENEVDSISADEIEEIEVEAVSGDSGDSGEVEGSDGDAGGAAGALANDNNNAPDMFGIKDAKPAETYSILTVIIIAGIAILVVSTWGVYQYVQKRKVAKELNGIEITDNNHENDNDIQIDIENDEKPLYETEIVTQES